MTENKNKFKTYQDKKVSGRLGIINKYIDIYKKQKIKFQTITELATTLANNITKDEGTPCSPSTLLRNSHYKNVMNAYLYSQPNFKKLSTASNLLADLTQSNLERENARLKNYIQTLESQLENQKTQSAPLIEEKVQCSYLSANEMDVAYLKKSLMILIKHFDGLVAINDNGDVVDLTKKINNVIINKVIKND